MGVLNVTPDSFFDGGQHQGLDAALARVHEMVEQGADLIDIKRQEDDQSVYRRSPWNLNNFARYAPSLASLDHR